MGFESIGFGTPEKVGQSLLRALDGANLQWKIYAATPNFLVLHLDLQLFQGRIQRHFGSSFSSCSFKPFHSYDRQNGRSLHWTLAMHHGCIFAWLLMAAKQVANGNSRESHLWMLSANLFLQLSIGLRSFFETESDELPLLKMRRMPAQREDCCLL